MPPNRYHAASHFAYPLARELLILFHFQMFTSPYGREASVSELSTKW